MTINLEEILLQRILSLESRMEIFDEFVRLLKRKMKLIEVQINELEKTRDLIMKKKEK